MVTSVSLGERGRGGVCLLEKYTSSSDLPPANHLRARREGGREERRAHLATLEQQYCHLPQVEVDEVFSLVGDVAAEVAADDAVPRWVVLLVKLLLDVCSNVLQ